MIGKQDAGGYQGADGLRGTSRATGIGCTGNNHRMPCAFQWSYQSVNYSFYTNNQLDTNATTSNKRFAWGADWGYLGQNTYYPINNNYNATTGSLPKRSYSTWVVLDPHSTAPTQLMADQASVIDNTTLTVTGGGTRRDQGPKGVADATLEAYSPLGFNHVYSTWEADVTGAGAVQMAFGVPAGKTLLSPTIVINNYTRNISPAVTTLNGEIISGYTSVNPVTHQLWLTLNKNLTGNNFLTISH